MFELLLAVYHPGRTFVNVKTYKIRRGPAGKFFGTEKTGVRKTPAGIYQGLSLYGVFSTPSLWSLSTRRSRGPRQSFWNHFVSPNQRTRVGLMA